MVCVVVGGQFGDEGKGKVMSYLCSRDEPDIVVRGGVGPNAGHTVIVNGVKYPIREMPSGFLNINSRLLIGTGVLIDPVVLAGEMDMLYDFDVERRLGVDARCTLITEDHRVRDGSNKYLSDKVQTTGTGCGPANEDRVKRMARRVEDREEVLKECPYLKKDFLRTYALKTDVPRELNDAIKAGKKIIVEGTQGFALSLYYGSYPYVTSKDTTAAAMLSDVGIGPTKVDDVMVVFKAYTSRVGGGSLEGELSKEDIAADKIWANIFDREKGTVTKRQRRVSKFNFDLARQSVMINGATKIAITCVDLLYPECEGAREYDDLSEPAKAYIKNIEDELEIPAAIISTGPDIVSTIDLREYL